MYLKKIEIAGFKSFADRTVIEFDTGLTAVVGPNGSGKSNITEAIRWVLGEQSAKNLRGGKMPDIIFAGAANRKPLNIAEVTVVLDNEERFLPLDFSEVSVTRRLKKTGESDFFINKQSCRLKDIVDLFMDSGLGKESFSIISQGKVEAIFNSKPEDRRGIFEEAAGVLKYKQRKQKAEQKLFETEDNLNRVQDIIYELEGQLEPLKEQSREAQEFLRLKEQFTKIDVAVTVSEIDELKIEWQAKQEKVQEIEVAIEEIQSEIKNYENQLVALRETRSNLDETIDRDQAQLLQVTESYEQTEGQKNVLVERSRYAEQTSTEYVQNLSDLEEKQKRFTSEIAELEALIIEKQESVQIVEDEIKKLEKDIEKYSKSAKERMADLRAEYVEIMQEQTNIRNDLKHLEKQFQQETSKNQQAVKKYEELKSRQSGLLQKQKSAEQQVLKKEQTIQQLQDQYRKVQTKYEEKSQELKAKERKMYDAMGLLQQARARKNSLQELQKNYAGFYQGVRAILKEKNHLTGIIGAVAELIQVADDYTLAIDTALGSSAQNVVVSDEKAGREAIQYLKNNRLGRATFLPVTTIKPRSIPNNVREQLKQIPGFLGMANERIKAQAKVQTVIDNILGMTILAKDLATANLIAKNIRYQFRVVSLEGDVMNPGGSMTGGASKKGNQGSLFSQANELQSLIAQLEKMEKNLTLYEQEVRQIQQEHIACQQKVEEVRSAGEQARLNEQAVKNDVILCNSELEQLSKEQRAFEYESQELQNFLDDYEKRKKNLELSLEKLDITQEKLDVEMNQMDMEESRNAERKSDLQDQLNQKLSQVAVLKEQLLHFEEQVRGKQQQLTEIDKQKNSLESQLNVLTNNSSTHQESQESLQKRMYELNQKKEHLQISLVRGKEKRETVHQNIQLSDQHLTEKNKQQQAYFDQKTKAEVAKSRAEVSLDNSLLHLQEEYSLTYEAAKESYPLELEIVLAKQELRKLKQSLDTLGAVNLGAIEQYEQVNERYEFLTTQRDDLLKAKNSLFETMNEMDEEVKLRFKEVFDAIREKFVEVFPNMFGGGHAELKLTTPDDLLHTGIEIEAQPPGKRLQSLSLLSGGERALTAIALLFSIIQVRPVPFCVLDEVEAALDEANVSRFGKYLSHFENETQFIVVTHRKGTMEAADVLYGVTMQESGVSKIVSVRLEDINERGDIETTA